MCALNYTFKASPVLHHYKDPHCTAESLSVREAIVYKAYLADKGEGDSICPMKVG